MGIRNYRKKSLQVAHLLSGGKPLNSLIKGILSAHYCFKTQQKKRFYYHNKSTLPNMKWWEKFIDGIESVPLKVVREKMTLKAKKNCIENSTVKSLSMTYETFKSSYCENFADAYMKELILRGKKRISPLDKTLIEQRILEIQNDEEY